MKIDVFNQKGEKTNQIDLPKEIFEVPMNSDLVHQVAVSQTSNQRQGGAKAKDRSEVRGGGKKPWRQKGTGRARHGSIRSPLWVGGGVTFGPVKEKNFKRIIPKKMRRKALFMVLSQKARDKELVILDQLKMEEIKTGHMVAMLKKLKIAKTLIALPQMDRNLILSSRNISDTAVIQARELNCLDVLKYKYLLMPKESIEIIKGTFIK